MLVVNNSGGKLNKPVLNGVLERCYADNDTINPKTFVEFVRKSLKTINIEVLPDLKTTRVLSDSNQYPIQIVKIAENLLFVLERSNEYIGDSTAWEAPPNYHIYRIEEDNLVHLHTGVISTSTTLGYYWNTMGIDVLSDYKLIMVIKYCGTYGGAETYIYGRVININPDDFSVSYGSESYTTIDKTTGSVPERYLPKVKAITPDIIFTVYGWENSDGEFGTAFAVNKIENDAVVSTQIGSGRLRGGIIDDEFDWTYAFDISVLDEKTVFVINNQYGNGWEEECIDVDVIKLSEDNSSAAHKSLLIGPYGYSYDNSDIEIKYGTSSCCKLTKDKVLIYYAGAVGPASTNTTLPSEAFIQVCDIDKNGDIVKNLPLKIADYGSNYTKYHGRCINLGNNEAMVIFPNPDDTTALLKCLIVDTNYTHGGIEILRETSFTKVGLLLTGLPIIPLNNRRFLCIYKDPSSTTADNTKWLSYIFTTPATVKPAETKIRGVTKSKLTTESVSNPNDDENVWVLPTNGPGYERHFASGEITIPTDATKIIIENVSKIPDNIILLKRWSYSVTNDVTLTLGYIKQGDICYYCDENWNKKSSLFSYEITSSYNISEYTSLSFIIDKDNLVIYNNSGFVDGDYIYFIM